MRFVPVKTEKQQGILVLHRSRDLLMRQRTMILNAIRAHFAECRGFPKTCPKVFFSAITLAVTVLF